MALRTAMSQGRTATGSELRFSFWLKATLVESEGPAMINREWGKHRVTLQCNVRGREVASFVREAQKEIAQQVKLPEGYRSSGAGSRNCRFLTNTLLTLVVLPTLYSLFNGTCADGVGRGKSPGGLGDFKGRQD